MNKRFVETQSIGEIVAKFPGASDVFLKYNIDFCCGGNRPLIQAIEEQKLDKVEVLEVLNNKYEEILSNSIEQKEWTKESWSGLIDYIVNTHHLYLKEELPKINDLLLKVLRAHGENHGKLLSEVHKLFSSLKTELEQHLIKEETIIFPIIKEYEKSKDEVLREKALRVIEELEGEHEGAGDILKTLRRITEDYKLPEDGCRTFALTYQKLDELEKDLFQHIHLENNILFKL